MKSPSMLFLAARTGQVESVRRLVADGVDVNATDEFGRTAAHQAARNGHVAVLEALHALGANLNAQTRRGVSPAHQAAYGGHVGFLLRMEQLRWRLDLEDVYECTPLEVAIEAQQQDAIDFLQRVYAQTFVISDCGMVHNTSSPRSLTSFQDPSADDFDYMAEKMVSWPKLLDSANSWSQEKMSVKSNKRKISRNRWHSPQKPTEAEHGRRKCKTLSLREKLRALEPCSPIEVVEKPEPTIDLDIISSSDAVWGDDSFEENDNDGIRKRKKTNQEPESNSSINEATREIFPGFSIPPFCPKRLNDDDPPDVDVQDFLAEPFRTTESDLKLIST